MRRLFGLFVALVLTIALALPALAADGELPHSGRVLMVAGGDITVPAGDQADAVLVFDGDATIRGEVNAVAVFDGTVRLEGATVEEVFIAGGRAEIDATSTVLNDVRTLDSSVEAAPGTIGGAIKGLDADLVAGGFALAGFLAVIWVGAAIALILAAVVLAGIASRQVRAATRLIRTDTGTTLLAGLAGLVVPPILAVLAFVTVVGIPLGLGILLGLWPTLAFVGYLVGAIWLGEVIVGQLRGGPSEGRPYFAALLGVVVLLVVGIVPVFGGLFSAVVSFLGLGAVILLTWRVFRGRAGTLETASSQTPAPTQAGSPLPV